MRSLRCPARWRVLGPVALCAVLESGCGLVLSLVDEPANERRPPDSGPPVGGHDVVDWDGDAALDPTDGAALDGGRPDAAVVDGGRVDGGERDGGGGPPDGGALDAADLDAADLDAADLDAADLDAADLDAADLDAADLDAADLDAANLDGGVPPDGAPCGTVSNLADDFSSPPSDWLLDGTGDVGVLHTGEGVRFDVPVGSTSATGYGRLVTRWVTSLRGDGIGLRFSALPSSTHLTTVLTLLGPGGGEEYLRLRFNGSSYRASVVSTSEGVDALEVYESETAYRHWRIRHTADDRVRFQVSDDGSTWRNLLTRPAPSWIDFVRPVLRVDGLDPGNPQVVVVDAVDGAYGAASWCPLGEVAQGFESGLGPAWRASSLEGCEANTTTGALTLKQSVDGVLRCAVAAAAPRTLRGQSVVVKIGERPPGELADTFAGLRLLGATHELWFGVRGGTVRATVQQIDGDNETSSGNSPPAPSPLYLRVDVSDDGRVDFLYAGSNQAFTPLWRHDGGVPLDEAELVLTLINFGGTSTTVTDEAHVTFAGVNAE